MSFVGWKPMQFTMEIDAVRVMSVCKDYIARSSRWERHRDWKWRNSNNKTRYAGSRHLRALLLAAYCNNTSDSTPVFS